MSIFFLDTAFILEVALIGAGLITLHKAAKEPPAGLLRAAGYLFIVAGILTATCTLFYGVEYYVQGDFDRGMAAAVPACMHSPSQMQMMSPGMMSGGMMNGGKMQDGMKSCEGGDPKPMSAPSSPAPSPGSAARDPHSH